MTKFHSDDIHGPVVRPVAAKGAAMRTAPRVRVRSSSTPTATIELTPKQTVLTSYSRPAVCEEYADLWLTH